MLKDFSTGDYSGAYPYGEVVLSGSVLYGTLAEGGNSGFGAIYRLNTDGGDYQLLKHFAGGEDGAQPYGGLLLSDGVLYGTTQQGGTFNRGVVFALSVPIPRVLRPPTSQTVEIGSSAAFTLATVTLTNTSQLYFDISAIGQPRRLYRVAPVP